jgi:hypothetical protein
VFGAIAKGTNEPFMSMTALKDITINALGGWQTAFQACFLGSSLPPLSSSDEINRNVKDLTAEVMAEAFAFIRRI